MSRRADYLMGRILRDSPQIAGHGGDRKSDNAKIKCLDKTLDIHPTELIPNRQELDDIRKLADTIPDEAALNVVMAEERAKDKPNLSRVNMVRKFQPHTEEIHCHTSLNNVHGGIRGQN